MQLAAASDQQDLWKRNQGFKHVKLCISSKVGGGDSSTEKYSVVVYNKDQHLFDIVEVQVKYIRSPDALNVGNKGAIQDKKDCDVDIKIVGRKLLIFE